MGLRKIGVFVVGLFLIIFLSSFISADACSIQSSCNAANTVMKLETATNAHGSVYNQGGYTSYLCCDFTGIHTEDGNNKVVGLYAATNAHAEVPSESNFGTGVYFGDLECASQSGSCPAGYDIPMLSLYATTNAHLGNFDSYATKVCCKQRCVVGAWEWMDEYQCSATNPDMRQRRQRQTLCPSGYGYRWVDNACAAGNRCVGAGTCVDNCKFTSATWGAGSAVEGNPVEMILTGTNCGSKAVTFRVYEDDDWPLSDSLVSTITGTFDRGTWTVEWVDDGPFQGDPEYYFIATLDAYTSMTRTSGLLGATTSCGNGNILGLEQCDDGNLNNNDGCSSTCTIEPGWSCTEEPSSCGPICGDSVIIGSEECDDGGTNSGDGCSDACMLEKDLYWANRYGEKIGNNIGVPVRIGSTVKLILNNSGLSVGNPFDLEVYEDDLIGDDEIRTPGVRGPIPGAFESIGQGIVIGEWLITQDDYDDSADNDKFVFRALSAQSNDLTILDDPNFLWCGDYTEQATCDRCDDYNCDAAENSLNKKVFETFPEQWGESRCGSLVQMGSCSYILNCKCEWGADGCGYSSGSINNDCPTDYPDIGKCVYDEDSTDTCEDGFLSFSWETRWEWGADNGYFGTNLGPVGSQVSDYVEEGGMYYFDPLREKEASNCGTATTTTTIACSAKMQLPFVKLSSMVAIVLLTIIMYVMLKRKSK